MEHKNTDQTSSRGTSQAGQRRFSRLAAHNKKPLIALSIGLVIIIFFILLGALLARGHRSESYKEVTGAAGLNATIAYNCKTNCDQKFNFNIYILREDGQQISVVRPDSEGNIRLALPEGNYVMLIGKQFGKNKLFPQEKIVLKNGKELELKLGYKEGGL